MRWQMIDPVLAVLLVFLFLFFDLLEK